MRPFRHRPAINRAPLTFQVVLGTRARGLHRCHRLLQDEATALPSENQSIASVIPVPQQPSRPPLSLLPLKTLVRSYLINALCSNRLLLNSSLRALSLLAYSKSPFLNPDRNPLLRHLLKKTFYAQFCGGESQQEIQATLNGLKSIGFSGVILTYAREIEIHDMSRWKKLDDVKVRADVESWKNGNLKTIDLTERGEFVGLKFTGAGEHAVRLLAERQPPSAIIDRATTEICELAKAKGVRLLFDAEQHAIQPGIDAWNLRFQKKYNRGESVNALVYGTYQAYLRSTPAVLARDLETAQREGFKLGVKLVRGAFLASDRRELFWNDKEETDKVYDGITEALITRKHNDVLRRHDRRSEGVPEADVMLATHNAETLKKAISLRRQKAERGEENVEMVYGQLMGMADEVSCELVLAGKPSVALREKDISEVERAKVFKYLVWGSVGECTKYLLRRAEENRDAVLRAKESRVALYAELHRRLTGAAFKF